MDLDNSPALSCSGYADSTLRGFSAMGGSVSYPVSEIHPKTAKSPAKARLSEVSVRKLGSELRRDSAEAADARCPARPPLGVGRARRRCHGKLVQLSRILFIASSCVRVVAGLSRRLSAATIAVRNGVSGVLSRFVSTSRFHSMAPLAKLSQAASSCWSKSSLIWLVALVSSTSYA